MEPFAKTIFITMSKLIIAIIFGFLFVLLMISCSTLDPAVNDNHPNHTFEYSGNTFVGYTADEMKMEYKEINRDSLKRALGLPVKK